MPKKKTKQGKELAVWDDTDIIENEVAYRKENIGENDYLIDELLDDQQNFELIQKIEEVKGDSQKILNIIKEAGLEDELETIMFNSASQDSDIFDMARDDFFNYLQEIIDEKNPDGYWYVRGENMGWRNLSGYSVFQTNDAQTFFDKVTPNTSDLTFRSYEYGKNGLFISVSHHDSPMGESLYAFPITPEQYEEYEETGDVEKLENTVRAFEVKSDDLDMNKIYRDGEVLLDWAEDWNYETDESESNGSMGNLVLYGDKYYYVATSWNGDNVYRVEQMSKEDAEQMLQETEDEVENMLGVDPMDSEYDSDIVD